jgi:hypothetical protein
MCPLGINPAVVEAQRRYNYFVSFHMDMLRLPLHKRRRRKKLNINGMIVAELKRRLAHAQARVEAAEEALAIFADGTPVKAKRSRKAGTKKRTLTPEQIAKMQAGRKAKKGPSVVESKGAPLAQAAGE